MNTLCYGFPAEDQFTQLSLYHIFLLAIALYLLSLRLGKTAHFLSIVHMYLSWSWQYNLFFSCMFYNLFFILQYSSNSFSLKLKWNDYSVHGLPCTLHSTFKKV